MIHLDTNYLIGLAVRGSIPAARKLLVKGDVLRAS
jgi:hypothetical protein